MTMILVTPGLTIWSSEKEKPMARDRYLPMRPRQERPIIAPTFSG